MIVIFVSIVLVSIAVLRIRDNRKREHNARTSLFESAGVRELRNHGFEIKDNLVYGTHEDFVVGAYYRIGSKPEYFTFINCKVPTGVSNMMTFNRKYEHEGIAIDSRSGFHQNLNTPITVESINTSIARLITIAQTENFNPLPDP